MDAGILYIFYVLFGWDIKNIKYFQKGFQFSNDYLLYPSI